MLCSGCKTEIDGTPKFCPRCGAKAEQPPVSLTEAQPMVDPFLGQTVGGRYLIQKLLGEVTG